jgi:hypothetical protein
MVVGYATTAQAFSRRQLAARGCDKARRYQLAQIAIKKAQQLLGFLLSDLLLSGLFAFRSFSFRIAEFEALHPQRVTDKLTRSMLKIKI